MKNKTLVLGTAQWGWTVPREEAFRLLDAWLAAGYRKLDAATNYPINKNPADFRASEKILAEYVLAHGLNDLDIIMKIGALDNLRTPDINLAPSFILMMAEEYKRIFDQNLRGIMLHWDNRSEKKEIRHTLEALAAVEENMQLRPGLSGIKYPETYAAVNKALRLDFDIEGKHNIFHSDIARYAPFFTLESGDNSNAQHHFYAYGINSGGVKLEGPYPADSTLTARGGNPEKAAPLLDRIRKKLPDWNLAFVRPPVRTMNHLGLIFAGSNPAVYGIILGPRSLAQLQETLDFWRNLETFDYSDVWAGLAKEGLMG